MLRMLVLASLMTAVICFSMPGRLSHRTTSLMGNPVSQTGVVPMLPSLPHSTAMRRSGSYMRFSTFVQIFVSLDLDRRGIPAENAAYHTGECGGSILRFIAVHDTGRARGRKARQN